MIALLIIYSLFIGTLLSKNVVNSNTYKRGILIAKSNDTGFAISSQPIKITHKTINDYNEDYRYLTNEKLFEAWKTIDDLNKNNINTNNIEYIKKMIIIIIIMIIII